MRPARQPPLLLIDVSRARDPKAFKCRPGFPDRCGSIEDARAFCVDPFTRYHTEHRHGGIAMVTPDARDPLSSVR